jgi:hypothetical protein
MEFPGRAGHGDSWVKPEILEGGLFFQLWACTRQGTEKIDIARKLTRGFRIPETTTTTIKEKYSGWACLPTDNSKVGSKVGSKNFVVGEIFDVEGTPDVEMPAEDRTQGQKRLCVVTATSLQICSTVGMQRPSSR